MALNAKDLRILALLDRDCRLSANQIAKRANLSQESVAYRIKQLEKKGIIEKYFVQINFFKLGYTLMRFYVTLQNASEKIIQHIIAKTLQEKNLWTIYETDGRCNLAIGLLVKNLNEYLTFQNKFISEFGQYVAQKEISVFTCMASFPKKYLDTKETDYASFYLEEVGEVLEIDDTDKKILSLLTKNARMHVLAIAKEVGLTANAVKYRIKQLEKKKIIIAYRAQINSKAIGYTYYKVDIVLNDTSIIPTLREYIKQHPNITFEDICVGGSDFEFDGEFLKDEDLLTMVDKLYEMFPGKIRNHYYYKAKKIHLYKYYFTE